MEPSLRADWQFFREQIAVCPRWSYLDNAAVAPISIPAREAIETWALQASTDGVAIWPEWARRVEQIRRHAAALINANADEIAFVPNTTSGITLIAEGLDWREGDNVVIPSNEFPTNQYPWMNLESRGVQTRPVPVGDELIDADQLLAACDERTRLIAVSWVSFSSGWRVDLDTLVQRAHEQGILVLVDAIQGLGVFPLDVRKTPVDFAAADGHKWLLGPEGAGLLYVRATQLPNLRPLNVGWNSVVHNHDYSRIEMRLREQAVRYEGGSQNMAGVFALGASLDLLAKLGLGPSESPIAERILQLTQRAREQLINIGARVLGDTSALPRHQSGIVVFDLPGRDLKLEQRRLLQAGVIVSCRGGRLRISPHAYCNLEDLDRLIVALEEST